jgi:hypothetical protein
VAGRWLLADLWRLGTVAGGLALLLMVRNCNRAGEEGRRADAAEERARLAAAGQVVVEPVEDLRPAVEELLRGNGLLREALERARRAAPGARPVAVVQASTGPRPAGGEPRPADPPPAGEDCPPSLLAPGDSTELRVDEVVLETRKGSHLLVGTATAWRLEPGPPTAIAWGAFEAPFTAAVEKAAPAKPAGRWGVGALGVASSHGWMAGGLLASPGLRVPWVGWQLEALAGGAAGPGGVAGLAAVVVRP